MDHHTDVNSLRTLLPISGWWYGTSDSPVKLCATATAEQASLPSQKLKTQLQNKQKKKKETSPTRCLKVTISISDVFTQNMVRSQYIRPLAQSIKIPTWVFCGTRTMPCVTLSSLDDTSLFNNSLYDRYRNAHVNDQMQSKNYLPLYTDPLVPARNTLTPSDGGSSFIRIACNHPTIRGRHIIEDGSLQKWLCHFQ